MEVSGQLQAPAALPRETGTETRYRLNRRLDGFQSRYGHSSGGDMNL